jgi:hypothetical protein
MFVNRNKKNQKLLFKVSYHLQDCFSLLSTDFQIIQFNGDKK